MSNKSPTPSTSGDSALAALMLAHKKEQHAIWPGNVPSQEQALAVLRGKQTLAVSLPSARKLQEKLTQPEREALLQDGGANALSEALAVRWRLAAALDLLLTSEGQVNQPALDTLMVEVDRVLGALRAMDTPSPELALAIDRTFESLTQEAVDFDSNVKAASNKEPAAPTPAPAPAPVPKRPTTSVPKVTFEPLEEPKQAARQSKAAYIALAVMLVAAGSYHVSNLMQSGKQESNYPGAPRNTLVLPSASNGALTVRSTLTGPTTPEQLAWLEQQKARGMQVKQVGPGTWLVTPAPKSVPATAGNTTP